MNAKKVWDDVPRAGISALMWFLPAGHLCRAGQGNWSFGAELRAQPCTGSLKIPLFQTLWIGFEHELFHHFSNFKYLFQFSPYSEDFYLQIKALLGAGSVLQQKRSRLVNARLAFHTDAPLPF